MYPVRHYLYPIRSIYTLTHTGKIFLVCVNQNWFTTRNPYTDDTGLEESFLRSFILKIHKYFKRLKICIYVNLCTCLSGCFVQTLYLNREPSDKHC